VLESLTEFISASPWTYAAIVGLVALDALLPLVPSETALISAGVLAGSGDLSLLLVVGAGAAGALAGDNAAYSVGRRFTERRRAWMEQKLASGGTSLFVVARFVPGGRTAATLAAGIVRYPWRRFLFASALGGLLWASAATLIGYGGGQALQTHPLLLIPIVLAAGAAYLLVKRLRRRAGNRLVMPPIRPVARTKRLPA
jgi:membrane protein DedA with SNARE-associated domain